MLGHQVRGAGVSRLMRRRVRLHRAQFALVLQEHRCVCSMPSRSGVLSAQAMRTVHEGVDRITLAQVERVAAGEPQLSTLQPGEPCTALLPTEIAPAALRFPGRENANALRKLRWMR